MKDEMILVEKNGEQIRVHPDALADHQRLGWKIVEGESVSVETPEAKPEAKPGKKTGK